MCRGRRRERRGGEGNVRGSGVDEGRGEIGLVVSGRGNGAMAGQTAGAHVLRSMET